MPALRWGPASYHPCKTNFRRLKPRRGRGPRECADCSPCIWASFEVSFLYFQIRRKPFTTMCQEKIQTLSQVWFCLELSLTGLQFNASCWMEAGGWSPSPSCSPCATCGRVCNASAPLLMLGRTLCVHTCACVHVQPWRLDDYCPNLLKEAGGVKDVRVHNGKIRHGGWR